MSDAAKQSVEPCKYNHEWTKVVLLNESPETDLVHCAVCGATPKRKEVEEAEAIADLRELLKPGDVVYTTVKNVSRSGMSRSIDVHLIRENEPRWIARVVARALGLPFDDKREAVKVGGCGMDMGFHLVYSLSRRLFPNGFTCSGKSCPSNDHFNDRTCKRETFVGKQHTGDGGYALNQRWL